jgi:hypothetical protein
MKKHLKLTLLIAALILGLRSFSQSEFSNFSKDTYWVNSEFQLSPSTFKDKILVVYLWDLEDPISFYNCKKIEAITEQYFEVQLVSLLKADTIHPITLSELTMEIHNRNLRHPVGVTADFFPFISDDESFSSKLFIYEKSQDPTLFTPKYGSIQSLIEMLESKLKAADYRSQFSKWQMKNQLPQTYFADPLVELPTSLAVDSRTGNYFVAENAQGRISCLGSGGELIAFAGGTGQGDVDGALSSAKVGFITGMCYDGTGNQLLVVDQLYNKIKGIDYNSGIVYTLLGGGKMATQPMKVGASLDSTRISPMDVEMYEDKLFILMTSPARIVEVDIPSKKILSIIELATNLNDEVPIQLNRATYGWIIITSKGNVLFLGEKDDKLTVNKIHEVKKWEDAIKDAVEIKGVYYLLSSRLNTIFQLKKNVLVPYVKTDGRGWRDGGSKEPAQFSLPSNLIHNNGELLVSDFANNIIRRVSLSKEPQVRSIPHQYNFEYLLTGDAINVGQPFYFDDLILGEGKNTLKFNWNLAGWDLAPEGKNEFSSDPGSGLYWEEGKISKDGLELVLDTQEAPEFVQGEIYLTLRSEINPNVIIIKKAFLNLSFAVIPGEEKSQDLEVIMNLLP